MRKLYTIVFMMCFWGINAQEYFPKNDGVKSENQNFSLLIQNGNVSNSGQNISLPRFSELIKNTDPLKNAKVQLCF